MIWVVMHHQFWSLILRETRSGVVKCWLFSQAMFDTVCHLPFQSLLLDLHINKYLINKISILKSLVIPAIRLALSSVIYSQITLFFVLNHLCSKLHHSFLNWCHFWLNRTIFAVYCIISVLGTQWDVKAFLFLLFNKRATWSNKYWYWLNSVISKWL